ncbi:MAG TPA: SMP-30/gluconolactonase/LRE family protein [Acidimicrobiales bacterium]|nr:SMP-30/gluconolactonase/LRE family protein [Acidimicrobiales bacterium]
MGELQDVEVVAEGLGFPEGPVALADGGVLVTEINRGHLTKVGKDGSLDVVADCGGGPNGAAIGPDGACYVTNNGGFGERRLGHGCIQRVDLASGAVEVLYESCDGRPLLSPNDLVFDTSGGLWFTDIGEAGRWTHERGGVYYAAADGSSIERAVHPTDVSNGIGLSPDGSILYFAETDAARVQRRRVAAPGRLVPADAVDTRTVFRGRPLDLWPLLLRLPGYAQFDSLAVDSAGNVCVGTLLDPGITVVSPDGDYEHLALPAGFDEPLVTNICFGGDDLTTAYLTLSMTGRLVSCRWPRQGLRLAFNA